MDLYELFTYVTGNTNTKGIISNYTFYDKCLINNENELILRKSDYRIW